VAAGGGGHEPNLTPFIDLFSVLICFLLMSTAWINLEVLPTRVEQATQSDTPSNPAPPNDDKVKLAVDLMPSEILLREGQEVHRFISDTPELDVRGVVKMLAIWKEKYPATSDIVLNTGATVKYGDMIKIYDLLVQNNFPDVGINPQ
jgi:biopolymer transport protein TolR